MAIISATQQAETRELLEPGRRYRLQRAKIMPLHSSLDDRVRLHLNKKENEKSNHRLSENIWKICLFI